MKIFILNCGSTSFKYQLIDMSNQKVLSKGLVEKIGLPDVALSYESDKKNISENLGNVTHKESIERVLELIVDKDLGVINALTDIGGVGHRIVHGGDKFTAPAIIDEQVLKDIEDAIPLAPLHNPAHIIGIQIFKSVLPNTPNVAVFDTAYHQTMPSESYRYAIPKEYYEKHKIRKYGFHGTSHKYVAMETAKMLNIPFDNFNAISCHLGGGASVAAIKNGKSYDTSMGFTPLQGLIMASRCGDIDPSVNYFLQKQLDKSYEEINSLYNSQSGVLALSGLSSDFRDIEKEASKGNEDCQLAIDAFVHRLIIYIAGYSALLGRVDAIIFTAGIGENGIEMRKLIADRLSILGVKIDSQENNVRGKARIISAQDSKIKLVLMPTNEELMIALETEKLI